MTESPKRSEQGTAWECCLLDIPSEDPRTNSTGGVSQRVRRLHLKALPDSISPLLPLQEHPPVSINSRTPCWQEHQRRQLKPHSNQAMASKITYDPEKDIPDLAGKVFLITGGLFTFSPGILNDAKAILL